MPRWYDDDDLDIEMDDDDFDTPVVTTRLTFPTPVPAEAPPIFARLALERWNVQARTFYRDTQGD